MRAHEPQRSSASAGPTLLARRAVDLLVSGVIVETLTAPRRYVLLLLQCLLYRAAPLWYLDLQPLKEAPVRPVRIAPAPVALLGPLPLRTASPFVVGAVALPAEAGVGGVVESGHLEGPSRTQSKRYVRR